LNRNFRQYIVRACGNSAALEELKMKTALSLNYRSASRVSKPLENAWRHTLRQSEIEAAKSVERFAWDCMGCVALAGLVCAYLFG
jgi:hypothetical protein